MIIPRCILCAKRVKGEYLASFVPLDEIYRSGETVFYTRSGEVYYDVNNLNAYHEVLQDEGFDFIIMPIMKSLRFIALSLILSLSLSACGSTTKPTTSLQSDKSSTQQTSAIASTNQQSISSPSATSTQQTTQTKNDQVQVQASSPSNNDASTNKESQNNDSNKQSSVQAASSTTTNETTNTTTTTEVKTEIKQEDSVKIINVTSPAPRNSTATLKAKVAPNATASIVVHYKSGASKAAGLEPKKADANGNVSWYWHVGGNTTIGNWRITVSSGNASTETTFEVVH